MDNNMDNNMDTTTVISFITTNQNKVNELQAILDESYIDTKKNFTIVCNNIDLPELQGEPEYIATIKCRFAGEIIEEPLIIEDTSLCFNALCGLPGPYIKWFLDKTGLDGLNKLLLGYEDKSAYAQTIFAYTDGKTKDKNGNKAIKLFIGRVNGKIVPARGTSGFGWDPIFQPDGEYENKTFGEMEQSKKNMISHRYLALQKVKEYFSKM